MAIPEAVRKQGEESEALAKQAGMIPGDQPVDENGNPVTAAPAAAAPATVTPIDPDGRYKALETQHRNYKASTDQTIHELRQQVSTDKAEIHALQSQINELKAKPTQVAPAAQTPENFEAGLKAWLALIPKEELDEYTDDYWRTQYIIKTTPVAGQQVADTSRLDALESKVNQNEQVQAKSDFDKYLEAMDATFPNNAWVSMTEAPEWNGFYDTQAGPYSTETYGQIVERSKGHDSATLIKVLTDFQGYLSKLNGGSQGAVNPLLGQITPEGGAGGNGNPIDEQNAKAPTFTESQVDEFYKNKAAKQYTPDEADALEAQIIAAANAGKIIPG